MWQIVRDCFRISTMNVIFMGTPHFAVPILQALIETQTVVGVVTQPDKPTGRGNTMTPPPVKLLAEQMGLPVYQPKSLKKVESAEPLRQWQPDLIVVAAFGQILRPHLLQLPPLGCVNIHASLLPRWRGAAPIHHAIWQGDHETGVCLMKMEEGLDTGPVYTREQIVIDSAETTPSLHDKLAELGALLIRRDLPRLARGELSAEPQSEQGVAYARIIKKEDGEINWHHSAIAIGRQLRALTPWPGSYTAWNGQLLKIGRATPLTRTVTGKPGEVIQDGQQIMVVTGEGALLLDEVQLAGKKSATVASFVNGHPQFIGTQLGAK